MTDAEVLMMDGCTRKEAERHLERGTTVFQKSDFEKNFDDYLDEWGIVEDDDVLNKSMFRKMLLEKKPLPDWGIVEDVDGNVYFIQYCL